MSSEKKIKIYILCHNSETLDLANIMYNKYWWANPILLKYKDYSFENAFWKQLLEIKSEWENCCMVGTLSCSSFKKINLDEVDEIINNDIYLPSWYYHFMDSNIPINNCNTNKHPHFMTIWNDVTCKLNLPTTTENNCNYWMCKPSLMKHFIDWYENVCLPALINTPLIFEDANYNGLDYNNAVSNENLIKIWGKPYYPYLTFIAERLNKCFFEKYYPNHVEKPNCFNWTHYTNIYNDLRYHNKVNAKNHYFKYGQFEKRVCSNEDMNKMNAELVRRNNLSPKICFLISHDKNNGGAQNCLFHMKKIYEQNNIKTILLYLQDINGDFNITSYILNESAKTNSCPVVFCNTLCCYDIVRKLSITNILTYWYIHEWYDKFSMRFFQKYMSDHSIFNSAIHLIFVCNSSFKNLKENVSAIKNEHIIYNTLSASSLELSVSEGQNRIAKEYNSDIYISIIGTVEERKNQQAFIDNVFYRCRDRYANVKLLIVGRISQELIINPLYSNSIIITGSVNNALPFINISDIIVSYSINEVLPLNVIESFYCNKPVVSSNVGGISEMITDGENGFLFEANSHNVCFDILCNLIENENVRTNIGDRAYETFLNKFEEKTTIDKILSLLVYS
jgi:glycosyltransferase involved in cell wall biosynthesis